MNFLPITAFCLQVLTQIADKYLEATKNKGGYMNKFNIELDKQIDRLESRLVDLRDQFDSTENNPIKQSSVAQEIAVVANQLDLIKKLKAKMNKGAK